MLPHGWAVIYVSAAIISSHESHLELFSLSLTEELKEKLTLYVDEVNTRKPGFIKVVRHNKQEGLIRSRVSGWRAATAPVVALFDAHVEFSVGW